MLYLLPEIEYEVFFKKIIKKNEGYEVCCANL